ncbi:MAG: hypothetical protein WCY41_05580 [Candidatus Micrarchaeia archaeon]
MWNKLNKKDRRLFNCLLYTIMSPVGFLLGWYVAMEQWTLVIVLMGVTMALDFVCSYTYMDIIGDRFENELEKVQGGRGAASPARR